MWVGSVPWFQAPRGNVEGLLCKTPPGLRSMVHSQAVFSRTVSQWGNAEMLCTLLSSLKFSPEQGTCLHSQAVPSLRCGSLTVQS